MNTKSLVGKLRLVVFLSVINTLATVIMIGQAHSGEFAKAFASGVEAASVTGNTDPSMISVEGVVLDR